GELEVAEEFALRLINDRSRSKPGDVPARVGIVLPAEVAQQLRDKGLITRRKIIDRDAQEDIIEPGALDTIKKHGFFFPLDSDTHVSLVEGTSPGTRNLRPVLYSISREEFHDILRSISRDHTVTVIDPATGKEVIRVRDGHEEEANKLILAEVKKRGIKPVQVDENGRPVKQTESRGVEKEQSSRGSENKVLESVRRTDSRVLQALEQSPFRQRLAVKDLIKGLDTFQSGIPAEERAIILSEVRALDTLYREQIVEIEESIALNAFTGETLSDEDALKLQDYRWRVKEINKRMENLSRRLGEAIGIRNIRLQLAGEPGTNAGSYELGQGVISLKAEDVLSEAINPELVGTIQREITHHDQDMLMLRYLMQRIDNDPNARARHRRMAEEMLETLPAVAGESDFARAQRAEALHLLTQGYRINEIVEDYLFELKLSEYAVSREFLVDSIRRLADQRVPMTPEMTERAVSLIESYSRKHDVGLDIVKEIQAGRAAVRTDGALRFAYANLRITSDWERYFGRPLPAEIARIKDRGVTNDDTAVMERYMERNVLECDKHNNNQAHEREALVVGTNASSEARAALIQDGRVVPAELSRRQVLEQGLPGFNFRYIERNGDRDQIRNAIVQELSSKEPDVVRILELLATNRDGGQRNLELLFGGKPPRDLFNLVAERDKYLSDGSFDEELTARLRKGFANTGSEARLESIRSEQADLRRKSELLAQRSQVRDNCPPLIDDSAAHRFIEKLTEELYQRRFDTQGSMLADRGTRSLADLISRYQNARTQSDRSESTARERGSAALINEAGALNQALSSPQLRERMVEGLRTSLIARFNDERLVGELEKVIKQSKIVVDRSVPEGQSRLVYRDASGKEFKPNGTDGNGNFTRSDGKAIPLSEVQVEIRLNAGLNSRSLGGEVLVTMHQAILDLTATRRLASAGVAIDLPTLKGEQHDRQVQKNLSAMVEQLNTERMRPLVEQTRRYWRQVCRDHGLGEDVEFPTKYDPKLAKYVHLAMRAASEDLKKAMDKPTLSLYEDLMAAYSSAHSSGTGPESIHRIFESNRSLERAGSDSAGGGLWNPPHELSNDQAEALDKRLKQFGENDLAKRSVQESFVDRLVAETNLFKENYRPQLERLVVLEQELLGSHAAARAVAALTPEHIDEAVDDVKRVTAEVEAVNQRLLDISKARAERLEKAISELCGDKMPGVKVKVGNQASYDPGSGEITVPFESLLSKSGGVELIADLFHEFVHSQQDALIMKRIADQLGIDKIETAEEFNKFNEAYEKATGSKLAPIDFEGERQETFLDRVLQQRSGTKLSEQEARKADELAQSFREAYPIGREYRALEARFKMARQELTALRTGSDTIRAAESLVQRLTGPDGDFLAEQLFGSKDPAAWPEEVRRLVENWRKTAKDGQGNAKTWNEQEAREILERQLVARMEQTNLDRKGLYEKYRSPLHEQEAHLLAEAIQRGVHRDFIQALVVDLLQERNLRARQWRGISDIESERLRQTAKDTILLANEKTADVFIGQLQREAQSWRDDLRESWGAGAEKRVRMSEAFERAFELAKVHA
ncbi:MAG: hypothetical protein K2Z81_07525, partial [Cyanobacteria bacterium]|nr:hypothetical protein [Cyanobacteriota bacterium]